MVRVYNMHYLAHKRISDICGLTRQRLIWGHPSNDGYQAYKLHFLCGSKSLVHRSLQC